MTHHAQRLLDADPCAADGLDGYVHAFAFGDFVHGFHRIDLAGVDDVFRAQATGDLQLGRHHVDGDHLRRARFHRPLQQDVPCEAHTVDSHHIAQLHPGVDSSPRCAAQRLVQTAHLERNAVGDALHMVNVTNPVVRVGGVDEAAHTVAYSHFAASQIFLYTRTHRLDGATAFVSQRPHGIGMGAVALAVFAQLKL